MDATNDRHTYLYLGPLLVHLDRGAGQGRLRAGPSADERARAAGRRASPHMVRSHRPAHRDHHPGSAELVARVDPLRDGTLGDILVAGSMRFPKLPECEPIPRGQALLALSEVRASDDFPLERLERDFPPRPRRFETTALRSSQVRKGCIQSRAQLFRFREADRFLYAWVMFGRDLSTGSGRRPTQFCPPSRLIHWSEPSPCLAGRRSTCPAEAAGATKGRSAIVAMVTQTFMGRGRLPRWC